MSRLRPDRREPVVGRTAVSSGFGGRGLPFRFSAWRYRLIAADAPFAILSSYGKADAAVVEELSDRVPTVVYAVQVRANEPAPLMRALAYVSDRMPTRMIRDVITSALERDARR